MPKRPQAPPEAKPTGQDQLDQQDGQDGQAEASSEAQTERLAALRRPGYLIGLGVARTNINDDFFNRHESLLTQARRSEPPPRTRRYPAPSMPEGRMWIEGGDWTRFRESTLKEIDHAVDLGTRHGIHVCLNFHRAPGYTVAKPPEEKSLWSDDEALRVCGLHWAHFAERYRGIPNHQFSFDLFNEPPKLEPQTYRRVVGSVCEAIRKRDASRLIICDGRDWGNTAPVELATLGVAAATRGYAPVQVSHYRASWMNGADQWPEPTWPIEERGVHWDKEMLQSRQIAPWKRLETQGVGVMVGEFGAYNRTPHRVVLAWMRDYVDLWTAAGWGWAMWNFTGSMGIIDSERADVEYENWHGHKLDREMLALVQGRSKRE